MLPGSIFQLKKHTTRYSIFQIKKHTTRYSIFQIKKHTCTRYSIFQIKKHTTRYSIFQLNFSLRMSPLDGESLITTRKFKSVFHKMHCTRCRLELSQSVKAVSVRRRYVHINDMTWSLLTISQQVRNSLPAEAEPGFYILVNDNNRI